MSEGWTTQQPARPDRPPRPYRTGPVGPPRRLDGLGRAVVVLGVVYLAVTWIATGLSFGTASEVAAAGGTEFVWTSYDWASIAASLVALATWVVVICWLLAARANAEIWRPDVRHARSSAWVGLGWIVPVVAFWFPYQVVRDIWRAGSPNPAVLNSWWGCWIAANVLSGLSGALAPDPVTGQGPGAMFSLVLVLGSVLLTVAYARWYGLVRSISEQLQPR